MREKTYRLCLYSFCIVYGVLSLILRYGEINAVSHDRGFFEWAKYAWLPSLVAGSIGGWIYGRRILGNVLSLKTLLLTAILVFFLMLTAEPYLAVINRSLGKQEEVTIEGTIIRKFTAVNGESGKRLMIEIYDERLKQDLRFEVNMYIFQSSIPGEEFKIEMTEGCLGWYY